MPVQQTVSNCPVCPFVDHLDRLVPVPVDADNLDEPLGRNPTHRHASLHLFEACHTTAGKETTMSLVKQVLMLVPSTSPRSTFNRHKYIVGRNLKQL